MSTGLFVPPGSNVTVTPWVAYTPTFTGFGTVGSITFFSRRVGESLEVRGVFVCGTPTGVPNKITIGFNGTSANVTWDAGKQLAATLAGDCITSGFAATLFRYAVLTDTTGGTSTVQLGVQSSTVAATGSGTNGNALGLANGNSVQVAFSVPITGWTI